MPKLVITGDQKKEAAGIPTRIVTQYRRYIDRLPDKQAGFLQFTPKEDMNQGREALMEAAAKSKKYIKIRKARGQTRTLQLQRCTKAEWDKANKTAKTAVKKTTTRRRGRKPGPKPKAAAAAPAPTAAAPAPTAPEPSTEA